MRSVPSGHGATRILFAAALCSGTSGALGSCRRPSAGSLATSAGPESGGPVAAALAPCASAFCRSSKSDWNGVIGTGQSLSVGAMAPATTLTTQPFHNLKLSLGQPPAPDPSYDPRDARLSVVPLVEPIRSETTKFPGAYPLNIFGETPHTAMGDEVSALAHAANGTDYVTVHVVVGESGQGIHVIDKGAKHSSDRGHAYEASLFEVEALTRLAASAGKTFGVRAIVLTHGETDGFDQAYENDVVQLLADYDADILRLTGQADPIQLLLSQQQTNPGDNSSTASIMAQWKLGIDHPGEITCVGPKYQYEYASDGLHLIAQSYDRLGEKYGEVYFERVVQGRRWQPLQPLSAVRRGRTISVAFHVPNPPLAWDDRLPAPHQHTHAAWAAGRGFEVQSDGGEETIESVAIDDRSATIVLARPPPAGRLVVRYAATQDDVGTLGGRATGRIGQLRDSDPLVGYATKLPLYNYALSFTMNVP